MINRLLQRRTAWCLTPLGRLVLLFAIVGPFTVWLIWGERYLAATLRVPADTLVLEAWTGPEGAAAAAQEFQSPGSSYRHMVVVGGMTGHHWTVRRWSLVEMAEKELLQSGLRPEHLILVNLNDSSSQRTFATAVAALHALQSRHNAFTGVNVITRGAHARRSRLVFARVFGDAVPVGMISWQPENLDEPWWQSSERAEMLLKETVGYIYELLLQSGRCWTSPSTA